MAHFYGNIEIEILEKKKIFGRIICSVRSISSGEVFDVSQTSIREAETSINEHYIKFIALAAKIQSHTGKQSILSPYESSVLPLPHQILALEKVMSGPFIRYLIADEVGMGKTIEAGLILKELKLRRLINKILVIVPKTAMLQWKEELKKHFNEDFKIYDTEYINTLDKTFKLFESDNSINIWAQNNQIIVTMDALKPLEYRKGWNQAKIEEYNQFRIKSVLEADFDLLIIDECHKVGGGSSTVGRYKMADILANAIPNVLLLSATPHRGKEDHFRRILQLLDSDAFAGEGMPKLSELEPYIVRTEKRQAIDYNGNKLFNSRNTVKLIVEYDKNKHKKQIELYKNIEEYILNGFNKALRTRDNTYGFVMILFQRMASSSTKAILDTMKGRLERLLGGQDSFNDYLAEYIENTDSWEEELDFTNAADFAKVKEVEYMEETEQLRMLIKEAQSCLDNEVDAKLEVLLSQMDRIKRIESNPDTKFIIFTEFTSTQFMLKEVLDNYGFRCSMINGSMDFEERIKALKSFKNETQVLISTDAAGESLNMQFAHIVINYDLPWNPMVIEQRIGRVDRIGQEFEVQAYNMMLNNSADARVYEVIEEKLNNILEQMGIDKTADVLDSTLDNKEIKKLYLSSLLDLKQFEQEKEKWLDNIKDKIQQYQATEGALPKTKDSDVTVDKTAGIKYSPIPDWIEELMLNYLLYKNCKIESKIGYYTLTFPDNEILDCTFDANYALSNPGIEHLSLNNERIINILNESSRSSLEGKIPVIKLSDGISKASGYLSIWKLEVKNKLETITEYFPFFIADSGECYYTYAEEIWSKIIESKQNFRLESVLEKEGLESFFSDYCSKAESYSESKFNDIEQRILKIIERIKINKDKSFDFQNRQLDKLGIENIRLARKKKLNTEMKSWNNTFEVRTEIIPSLNYLLIIRIQI
jgi:superfamily II DNA or RNA helicase